MKQEYSDIVNELLPRYCEGAVSPEERKIVEVWIKQSDENRRIAKQIHTIYLATDTINILEKVNTEKALEKVFFRYGDKKKVHLVESDTAYCCCIAYSRINYNCGTEYGKGVST